MFRKTKVTKPKPLTEIVASFRTTIDELLTLTAHHDARVQQNRAAIVALHDESDFLEAEGRQANAIADRLAGLIGGAQ